MSETKLINFDVISTKPTKPILLAKPLNSFNNSYEKEESELEGNSKIEGESVSYDKTIDQIASSTSGLINNTSINNSPKQMLNPSINHEKIGIYTSNVNLLKQQLLTTGDNSEGRVSSVIVVTKPPNENTKGKTLEKESSTSSLLPSKYVSIDVLNNSAIIDMTDTSTISNEVMTISSEDESLLLHKACSEISETTLNQSQQPYSLATSGMDCIPTFRLSTSALELPRSVSPSSPTSPKSPSSPSSMIITPSVHPVIGPRSYSALALIEDTTSSSPLRNSISVFPGTNYTYSYANSILDDGNENNDSESVLNKKKKSVRFSNIVDVIDSDQKDTLAKLKALDINNNDDENNNDHIINIGEDNENQQHLHNHNQDQDQDLIFPELTTIINVDEDRNGLADINSTALSTSNSNFGLKIEEAIAFLLRYIILAINGFFKLFKHKSNKDKSKSNSKKQYAIINDNNISELTDTAISPNTIDEDDLSQSSTVGDSSCPEGVSSNSVNVLKELNATGIEFNLNIKSSNKIINSNTNDIELYPVRNTIGDFGIPSRPKRPIMPLTPSSSASSLNSNSTCNSISSTAATVSVPLSINNLSQQNNGRIVRYWYNDPKRKTMAQRFGLSKSQNSNNSNVNLKHKKVNASVKEENKPERLNNKVLEVKNKVPMVKRSSLVNFTPTNIDINSIPNISATTTTNTILNSSSSYRNDKIQNNNNGVQHPLGKEIIIRDINSNDEVYYALKLEAERGKVDLLVKNNQGKVLSTANIIHSAEGNSPSEKNENISIPNSPSSIASSNSTSSISSDKRPLKKSARKFSHRRQNSVRLQISY